MRAGGELKRSQPSDELRDMLKMETALRKRPQNSSRLFGFAVAACKTTFHEHPIHFCPLVRCNLPIIFLIAIHCDIYTVI